MRAFKIKKDKNFSAQGFISFPLRGAKFYFAIFTIAQKLLIWLRRLLRWHQNGDPKAV